MDLTLPLHLDCDPFPAAGTILVQDSSNRRPASPLIFPAAPTRTVSLRLHQTTSGTWSRAQLPAGHTLLLTARRAYDAAETHFTQATWTATGSGDTLAYTAEIPFTVPDSIWLDPAGTARNTCLFIAQVEIRNASATPVWAGQFTFTLTRDIYATGETPADPESPLLDETAADARYLKFSAAQTLTSPQKTQAWANLGGTSYTLGLISAAGASAHRTALGLSIGTHVQAYSLNLASYANITPGAFAGTFLPSTTPAAARSALELGNADTVTFNSLAATSSLSTEGTLTLTNTNTGAYIEASGGGFTAYDEFGAPTATFSTSSGILSLNQVELAASPTLANHAASKSYVDNLLAGLKWKNSVTVATTTNGTLATAFAAGQTVDGVTLVAGDRILIKDQTTQTQNGIYTVNTSGAPTRATDADTGAELVSAAVCVQTGSVNADRAFVCTNNAITLGSTNITFVNFAATIGSLVATNNLSDLSNVATAVANLGLVIGTHVQAYSANLQTLSGITPGATGQTLLAAATVLAARLALQIGVSTSIYIGDAAWTQFTISGAVLVSAYSAGRRVVIVNSSTAGLHRWVYTTQGLSNPIAGPTAQVNFDQSFRATIRARVQVGTATTSIVSFHVGCSSNPTSHDPVEKTHVIQVAGDGASGRRVRVGTHTGSGSSFSSWATWTPAITDTTDMELVWLTATSLALRVNGTQVAQVTTSLPSGLGTSGSTSSAVLVENVSSSTQSLYELISWEYSRIY